MDILIDFVTYVSNECIIRLIKIDHEPSLKRNQNRVALSTYDAFRTLQSPATFQCMMEKFEKHKPQNTHNGNKC